jgi:hypothetical protein
MVKNLLMGGKKPMTIAPSLPMGGMGQKGGKMKTSAFGKKAKKVAEDVPTGPMKKI